MTKFAIAYRSPSELKPYTRNARTHSPKQIAEIAASIKAFGFNNPVLIDKDNGIVALPAMAGSRPQSSSVLRPCPPSGSSI
jgi:hypothetical protein